MEQMGHTVGVFRVPFPVFHRAAISDKSDTAGYFGHVRNGKFEISWDTKRRVSSEQAGVSFQKIDARKIRDFRANETNETNETLLRGIVPCLICLDLDFVAL